MANLYRAFMQGFRESGASPWLQLKTELRRSIELRRIWRDERAVEHLLERGYLNRQQALEVYRAILSRLTVDDAARSTGKEGESA